MTPVSKSSRGFLTNHRLIASFALSIVPLAIVIFLLHRTSLIWPIFVGLDSLDYDPAYVYLFNGLSLAEFAGPRHIGHPGTATQFLVAVLLRLYQFALIATGAERTQLFEVVADDPEHVLFVLGTAVVLIYASLLYVVGHYVWRMTESLAFAILIQLSSFLIGDQLIRLAVLNGETTGFLFSLAFLGLYIREWAWADKRRGDLERDRVGPILIGLCAASIIFSKLTFAPLLLLLPALVGRRRRLLAFGALFGVCALYALLMWQELPRFFAWVNKIAWHSGQYGHGETGLVELSEVPRRAVFLLDQYPAPAVMFGLALVWIMLSALGPNFRLRNERVRFVLLAMIGLVVQFLMVLKHFGGHYSVPSLALSAMLMSFFLFQAAIRVPNGLYWRLFGRFAIVIYIGLLVQVVYASLAKERGLQVQKVGQKLFLRELRDVRDAHADTIWIGMYRSRSPDFAAAFALGYVVPSIAISYERAVGSPIISFNRWNGKFYTSKGWRREPYINDLVRTGQEVIFHPPAGFLTSDIDLRLKLLAEFSDGSSAYSVLQNE